MRATLFLTTGLILGGCATQSPPRAPLVDTYWRLAEIEGKSIPAHPGAREPHIVLARDGSRLSGFAGCNGFAGKWEQHGETLRLGDKLAMTRMACVGDGDALEAAFTKALASTASYRISGDKLELRDSRDAVRMVFEARGPVPPK